MKNNHERKIDSESGHLHKHNSMTVLYIKEAPRATTRQNKDKLYRQSCLRQQPKTRLSNFRFADDILIYANILHEQMLQEFVVENDNQGFKT